ncbi:MAG: class I SAM-dependent methyltransferase, partial [Solirubrobacteraceae bacterium]
MAEKKLGSLPIGLRLWDGTELHDGGRPGAPTVVISDPGAIAHLLRAPGELGIARAWVSGQLEVEGDLEELLAVRAWTRAIRFGLMDRVRLAGCAVRLAGVRGLHGQPIPASEARANGSRHTLARDRAAIRHHYDASNHFYELLLGPGMCYSSGFFESPEDSLDRAQQRKLERICRKLSLQPGERLLDI